MAGSTQQFGVRESSASKVVNEHHTSPPAKVCGICAFIEYPTDACPTLQETELTNVEVATMMGGQ
ncbi:hypothetical protein CR513_36717, partial [Mucuna pruriens]